MSFDFDTPLQLRGTHCSKYDGIKRSFGVDDPDIIPMWVADMDFRTAPAIRAALQADAERGYFGYYTDPTPVSAAVANWYRDRHGWDVDPGCIRYTHGVVNGFGDVLAAFSAPGDAVIVFSPVYHAFFRQIRAMGREVLESPLVIRDGVFHMDLEALAERLTGREKILTLCSPHNPGGRLWTVEEIKAVVAFCAAHDLILVSDEIHMDLTFPGVRFTPTAVAAPECLNRLVVLTAASKGFNIAGAETGLMLVPDQALMRKLEPVLLDRESSPSRFGMPMIQAAFGESGDWSEAVRAYIAENFRIFEERISKLPSISVMPMEATYLSWVDFSALGMTDAELQQRVLDAKIAANPGTQFGTGGEGHMRFNLALPRATLLEAISRLETAFSDVQ